MAKAVCARERRLMDFGWKFHLGDIPVPPVHGHLETYMAGEGLGAARADFDDSAWRRLDLPHDWAVEQPFDSEANLDQGFKARGIAWYRRAFQLDPADEGKRLTLEFGAVASHCTIWLNGQLLHRNWCGYTPFTVDITDMAVYGDRINTLAVRVDASVMEGWWYEGAGIYRHVWLTATAPLHVATWGTWVNPVKGDGPEWRTPLETTVVNDGAAAAHFTLASTIYSPDGQAIGRLTSKASAEPGATVVLHQQFPVTDPALWAPEHPHRYTLDTELLVDGTVVDDYRTTFGYRTIAFDAERGFLLNGQPLKITGTCNHQDHAGVGVAVPDALQEYRIARLREMGSNAYRCAHNSPAEELLDACDRLGMLVMDENRHFNSAPEYLAQLRAMLRRDRNHPSIFLWSIFNEEPLQGTPTGRKIAETMAREVKTLDPTRPITAAMSGGVLEEHGVGEVVDVMGINYQLFVYDDFHAKYPHKPVIGSENGCTFSTRGVYTSDPARFVFDSYDEQHAGWGARVRTSWQAIATRPFVSGIFEWTGFDYRGEPSPYAWPCINSHWGILDTCGFAKDAFYLHRALWVTEPVVHLLPHWTWPGREGETIPVMCFTNGTRAELFLNGESLGAQAVDPFEMVRWEVPYQPGRLTVVVEQDGRVYEESVEIASAPVALRLTPYREALQADGEDVMPVTVSAVDAQGRPVPTAEQYVTFAVSGPGTILGVGNGDPLCHEPDKASARSLFHGLAQVILQARAEAGTITLTADAPGLAPATLTLEACPAARRPYVPVLPEGRPVLGWRMSPVTAERPDPNMAISASDMNTWQPVEVGGGPQAVFPAEGGYALYRTTVTSAGGTLNFRGLQGAAEVYLDGVLAGAKVDLWHESSLQLRLPAGQATLTVLIQSPGGPAGISKPVEVIPVED